MNQYEAFEALKICQDEKRDSCTGCPLVEKTQDCTIYLLNEIAQARADRDMAMLSAITATRNAADAAVSFVLRNGTPGEVYIQELRKAIEGE